VSRSSEIIGAIAACCPEEKQNYHTHFWLSTCPFLLLGFGIALDPNVIWD
jgi:hypothetical protein